MARTLTACRDCGKLFYGGTEKQYCEKCTEARKKSVMREKVCQDCGRSFMGDPEPKDAQNAELWQRGKQTDGTAEQEQKDHSEALMYVLSAAKNTSSIARVKNIVKIVRMKPFSRCSALIKRSTTESRAFMKIGKK